MVVNFTKMHGIGNDYCYISQMNGEVIPPPEELAMLMSPRHFSVGSDGVILVCPPENPENDGRMRMFNADGSEGKMCGNGIRCVGKYIYDKGYCSPEKDTLRIETLSGVKILKLNIADGEVASVVVNMGQAVTAPVEIPCLFDGERMVNEPVKIAGKTYRMTAVSMGNPHAVIFINNGGFPDDIQEVSELNLEKIGPDFENCPLFPERVNTEFIKIIDRTHLDMRVWERGSGETYACGTGTCAAVTAAILCGICDYDTPVTVKLIGGELKITVKRDMTVYMEGACETVYEGKYYYRG